MTIFAKSIILGNKYTDKIHGFTGFASILTRNHTNCDRVLLEVLDKAELKSLWFDVAAIKGVSAEDNHEAFAEGVTLGQKYTDKTHGFKGIATAQNHYLTGCDQIRLEVLDKKASEINTLWFDITDLVGVKVPVAQRKPGGPKNNQARRSGER